MVTARYALVKRRTFRVANKLRAIKMVERGCSIRKAALKLKLDRKTLRSWVKSKEVLKTTRFITLRSYMHKKP